MKSSLRLQVKNVEVRDFALPEIEELPATV